MQALRSLSITKISETDSAVRTTAITDKSQVPSLLGILLGAQSAAEQTGNLQRKNKRMRPRATSSADAVIA